MEIIVYDDEVSTLMRIVESYDKGEMSVVCPVCRDEVIVVLNLSDAKLYKRGPGIYCRNNHFTSIFNVKGK